MRNCFIAGGTFGDDAQRLSAQPLAEGGYLQVNLYAVYMYEYMCPVGI